MFQNVNMLRLILVQLTDPIFDLAHVENAFVVVERCNYEVIEFYSVCINPVVVRIKSGTLR